MSNGYLYIKACSYENFSSILNDILEEEANKYKISSIENIKELYFGTLDRTLNNDYDKYAKTIVFGEPLTKKHNMDFTIYPRLDVYAIYNKNEWMISAFIPRTTGKLVTGLKDVKPIIKKEITILRRTSIDFFVKKMNNHLPGISDNIFLNFPYTNIGFTHNGRLDIGILKKHGEEGELLLSTPFGNVKKKYNEKHRITYQQAQRLLYHNNIGKLVGFFLEEIPVFENKITGRKITDKDKESLRAFRNKTLSDMVSIRLSEKLFSNLEM